MGNKKMENGKIDVVEVKKPRFISHPLFLVALKKGGSKWLAKCVVLPNPRLGWRWRERFIFLCFGVVFPLRSLSLSKSFSFATLPFSLLSLSLSLSLSCSHSRKNNARQNRMLLSGQKKQRRGRGK